MTRLAISPAAPYRGRIVYFRVEEDEAYYRSDPTSGWGEIAIGGVTIVDVEGNVEAQTSGGAMDIADVSGRIEAVTSGGAISASFRTEPSGVLKTSGGRIEVAFPADAGVDLDAETSGGSVSVELPVLTKGKSDRNHVVGKINGGGALLQLRTSGGNISVRAI